MSDLDKAVAHYQSLFDFDAIEKFEIESEGVKIAMIKAGQSEIELLAPAREDGPIAKFIRERGEGIHHIAIRVENVSSAIASAKALGLRVIDERPRKGARGAEAAFVHPKSMRGVLLEFYDH